MASMENVSAVNDRLKAQPADALTLRRLRNIQREISDGLVTGSVFRIESLLGFLAYTVGVMMPHRITAGANPPSLTDDEQEEAERYLWQIGKDDRSGVSIAKELTHPDNRRMLSLLVHMADAD